MAKVDWGIESIKFTKPVGDGTFPDFDQAAGVMLTNLIVVDSYSETEEANTSNDIEWEDSNYKLRLPGSVGNKTITFESNDLSGEQYKYFKGYKESAGYIVENPDSDDTLTLAMQLKTKAVNGYPARVHEYTPVLVEVKKNGTTGKNGLPNLTFTVTRQPNFDEEGKALGGHRFKDLVAE